MDFARMEKKRVQISEQEQIQEWKEDTKEQLDSGRAPKSAMIRHQEEASREPEGGGEAAFCTLFPKLAEHSFN